MTTKYKGIISLIALIVAATIVANLMGPDEVDSTYSSKSDTLEVGVNIIHHLSDDGICGITNYIGDSLDYEAFAGLKVHCEKTNVEYTMYSHADDYVDGKVSIKYLANKNSETSLGTIKEDETKSFDIKSVAKKMGLKTTTGIYLLTIKSAEDYKQYCYMYLYYDGKKVQTCRVNGCGQDDIDAWNKLIGNLDPDTCLDMWVGNKDVPITYPTSGQNGNCNHVQKWCDKSEEIIKHDDWSDELKVYALVMWMNRNLAYDNYRVDTLKNTSRATKAGKWNDDSLFTYGNNVGQCWDFANILTIMCRHQGIPCTTVENYGHAVNAVWLRDEWVAIDVSELVGYHCYTKDTNKDGWKKFRNDTYHRRFGYFDSNMETYNQSIATPEIMSSTGSGKNPQ